MPRVSVIVPVFNVCKELYGRCLKSLSEIDVLEYEILVINDGSDIQFAEEGQYEKLAKRYSCVKYFSQKHEGVVSARLTGLRHATGDYIAFVDADDWIDKSFFKKFVDVMEADFDVDICVGAMVRNFSNGIEQACCEFGRDIKMPKKVALEEMLSFRIFRWELCGKLYRRHLFFELPDDDVKVYEDLNWNWELFRRARFVFYSGECKYHYYVNPDSVTQRNNRMDCKSLMVFQRIWKERNKNAHIMRYVYIHYAKNIFHNLQWVLLKDISQGMADRRLQEYCQELVDIRHEIKMSYRDIGLDFPDDRIFSIISRGCEELYDAFAKYVDQFSKELLKATKKNKKIYIYGIGGVSKFITRVMDMYDIPVMSYVVSDGQGYATQFKGRPVKNISDISIEFYDGLFVLAMLEKAQKDISKVMKKSRVSYMKVDTRFLGFE